MVPFELGWTCGGRAAGDWTSPDVAPATAPKRVGGGNRRARPYGRGLFVHHGTGDRVLALIQSGCVHRAAAVMADSPLPAHIRDCWCVPRVCLDHLRD